MSQSAIIHQNFIRDVKTTFANEIKKPMPPQCEKLLSKPLDDLLNSIRLLIEIAGSSIENIQKLVLADLGVSEKELHPQTLKKFYRYAEYFVKAASVSAR